MKVQYCRLYFRTRCSSGVLYEYGCCIRMAHGPYIQRSRQSAAAEQPLAEPRPSLVSNRNRVRVLVPVQYSYQRFSGASTSTRTRCVITACAIILYSYRTVSLHQGAQQDGAPVVGGSSSISPISSISHPPLIAHITRHTR